MPSNNVSVGMRRRRDVLLNSTLPGALIQLVRCPDQDAFSEGNLRTRGLTTNGRQPH